MRDTPARATGLAEGYEALRAFILGQQVPLVSPQGLALFLRQGMAGWMEAWRVAAAGAPVNTRPSASIPTRAVWSQQVELAAVLAGMALAAAGRR